MYKLEFKRVVYELLKLKLLLRTIDHDNRLRRLKAMTI